MFDNAIKTVKTFFENVKQIKVDKENRKKFISEIGLEIQNPNSKFNQMRLSIDGDYKKISCYIVIPENFQLEGTDAMIYQKLKEESRPINEYIGRDIMWGEYFVAPEFYYVEDEEDNNHISCTYLGIWNYTPVLKGNTKFWRQFASFISMNSILLAGIITCLCIVL